jgi:FMN-dependent NADH-azoreductase
MLNNKLIAIDDQGVSGLLDDKDRRMIYVQSSGGDYPDILWRKFNVGVDYFKDIFKFLGVEKFRKLLVEGVDMSTIGKESALQEA